MSDNPKDHETMRTVRIRLEGGSVSELEHNTIEKLNSQLSLTLLGNTELTLNLSIQSLSELIISAISWQTKKDEDFNKNIYNYMKDYFFPQAEKMRDLMLKRQKEQQTKTHAEQLLQIETLIKKANPDITSGNFDQVLDQYINKTMPDNCPCSKCVARREREKNTTHTPNPNTKH